MPISENQSIGMAILATLFAYDGWILLASIGGEMKNPTKLLPKAMTVGILIVTAAYVLINLALLNVLPAAKIVDLGENATATAAGMLLGEYGGKIISIGIIVSIFGCLNGKILTFHVFQCLWQSVDNFHFLSLLQRKVRDLKHQQMRLLLKSF